MTERMPLAEELHHAREAVMNARMDYDSMQVKYLTLLDQAAVEIEDLSTLSTALRLAVTNTKRKKEA